ncbi:hypothetical protein ACT3TC_08990 [Halomonas sp. AOP27-A1-41]|uniref:hypothetical protein n=1 Tax=Halomonas sp. AOP27-A1-41 TaxID=3457707 RepID=UPI00403315A6
MTTPTSLREAEMEARARRAVMESGDWLTVDEILQLPGVRSRGDSGDFQPSCPNGCT